MVDNGWGQSVYPIVRSAGSPASSPPSVRTSQKFKEGDHVGVGCFVDAA
jgi:uncharacterized zinc-type alcohol dehydrogenase-like protein